MNLANHRHENARACRFGTRINLKFRGYISSRNLTDGSFVDQSIQNLIIRRSCKKHNFEYMLSATEYGMKNCFLMLQSLVKYKDHNQPEEKVVYCS